MDPFTLFPLIFGALAIFVVGSIVVAAAKGVAEWSYNNGQPVLTARARIVGKRTDVRTRHANVGSNDAFHNQTRTDYYVTFELDSGERREIEVGGAEYGQLAEGDEGSFTYQGTRYKGFVRQR